MINTTVNTLDRGNFESPYEEKILIDLLTQMRGLIGGVESDFELSTLSDFDNILNSHDPLIVIHGMMQLYQRTRAQVIQEGLSEGTDDSDLDVIYVFLDAMQYIAYHKELLKLKSRSNSGQSRSQAGGARRPRSASKKKKGSARRRT